jgi:hypothetical protein
MDEIAFIGRFCPPVVKSPLASVNQDPMKPNKEEVLLCG